MTRKGYQEDRDRVEAEIAFVREGRSFDEIGLALHRRPATILQWAEEGGWLKKREQFLLSAEGVPALLQEQLRRCLLEIQEGQGRISKNDADTALKIARAIQEFRGNRPSIVQTFQTVQDFILFLRGAKPDLLPTLEPLVERFLHAQRKTALGMG